MVRFALVYGIHYYWYGMDFIFWRSVCFDGLWLVMVMVMLVRVGGCKSAEVQSEENIDEDEDDSGQKTKNCHCEINYKGRNYISTNINGIHFQLFWPNMVWLQMYPKVGYRGYIRGTWREAFFRNLLGTLRIFYVTLWYFYNEGQPSRVRPRARPMKL